MAILKDLIVHGSSRFLNKIYANEIQAEEGIFSKLIAKNADITDLTVYGLLDSQGQLHTKTWTNSNIATIDGSFYITPTLNSDSGTFRFISTSGQTTDTVSTNARFIGDFSVMNSNSMYLGGKSPTTSSWTADSKVLITGQVKVNNEWIPLGNVVADISSVSSTTLDIKNIRTTINGNTAPSTTSMIYFVKPNQTLSYRNLKISLCEIYRNSASNPLGIYITSSGLNGKTFLDIYGGVEATSTAGNSGGLAKPNVRIGNLSGLNQVEGVTPVGWGIYTTNGYFEGVLVSSAGKIGGWSIGTNGIYNGITGVTTSGTTSGTFIGTGGISNYQNSSTYVNIQNGIITAKGANFLTATIGDATNKMTIGNGTNNQQSAIKYGMSGLNDTTNDGFYIGTDGIALGKGAFKVTAAGALTATSGSISGFQIDGTSIRTNGVAVTSNADNSISLSSTDFTRTINSVSRSGLRFAMGDKFGVTGDGSIYASNVDLTGKITATDGSIGGATITGGVLTVPAANVSGELTAATISGAKITSGTIEIGKLNTATQNAISDAAKIASDYITAIDANGIWVTPSNLKPTNTSTGAGATGTKINASGMEIFKSGSSVASYGDVVRIGETGQSRIEIDFHSLQLKDKESTPYLYVSDLRNASGVAENVQESFTGDGINNYFTLFGGWGIQSISSVTINGTATSAYTHNDSGQIIFNSAPADGAEIVVTYTTTSHLTKVYTFGQRSSNNINVIGLYSYAEGHLVTASGTISHAEGYSTTASGSSSHAEGYHTTASKQTSHAEGYNTTASGSYSHAEGHYTTASSFGSHAEGNNTTASGPYSHAEGGDTTASGSYSHAEGSDTTAREFTSHAEGYQTTADGSYSHAEGYNTIAGGVAHAEGYNTTASGSYSHAEGSSTTASSSYSHAEGYNTTASGSYSHAEGSSTTASGSCSHAQNRGTIAQRLNQTAIGMYNEADTEGASGAYKGKYAFIIGNGTADDARSDAFAVTWDGNIGMALSTITASGTDYNLYTAITTLGWESEVLE